MLSGYTIGWVIHALLVIALVVVLLQVFKDADACSKQFEPSPDQERYLQKG